MPAPNLSALTTRNACDARILAISSLEGEALEAMRRFADCSVAEALSMEPDVRPHLIVMYVYDARMMTASGEVPTGRRQQIDDLKRHYHSNRYRVYMEEASLQDMPEPGEYYPLRTIIHIEGGQTFAIDDILARHPEAMDTMREWVASGARIVGQSAGSITLGTFNTAYYKGMRGDLPAYLTNMIKNPKLTPPNPGSPMLGLINGVVMPHYDERDSDLRMTRATLIKVFGKRVYCIANGGYAMFDHRRGRQGKLVKSHLVIT